MFFSVSQKQQQQQNKYMCYYTLIDLAEVFKMLKTAKQQSFQV